MSVSPHSRTRLLPSGLRATLALFAAMTVLVLQVSTGPAEAASRDPAVAHMQRVAKELIRAHRRGSVDEMARVMRRRGDVPAIGQYSLGTYFSRIPKARRTTYYGGMTRFMARYLIDQSKRYRIARVTFSPQAERDGRVTLVNSSVVLTDGATYNVQWRLVKRRGAYKVNDVKVLGFWVLPFQRNLFRSYVRKAGGNVNALVLALNQ